MTIEIHLPPKKQFKLSKHQSALGGKRRREAELEKERTGKERIEKVRENSMMSISDKNGDGGIVGRKRTKKAKRGGTPTPQTTSRIIMLRPRTTSRR